MISQQSPLPRRRLSILIADDDRDTVSTLTVILLDEGHRVHMFYRGDDVLSAVRRYKPDVCILDIDLPGLSGYALAQELSAAGEKRRPVLVAISGKYVRKSEQLLAETSGFDVFFTKPADPQELLRFLDGVAKP
jgi:DNA-binding response OmpR family regulator